ncbi:MAG: hypothetical protein ACHQRM_07460 [Bacteroidia bacterium]
MVRFKAILFLVLICFSLCRSAIASSTPGLLAHNSLNGLPVIPENNVAAGKNPFSIHITIGFPAEIAEKKNSLSKTADQDSARQNQSDKKNNGSPRIYEYETETGDGNAWHHTSAALRQAMNLDADMVYIHINPFADFNTATTDIRNKLTEYNKPVTVFLDNGSDKNGAIISVRSETNGKSGTKPGVKTSVYALDAKQVREKYKDCVNNSPQTSALLPFTIRTGTVAGSKPVLFSYKPRPFEKFLDFLLLPFISFLLILGMGLSLLSEIHKPGRGFPLFASVFFAVLFFTPLSLDGLAETPEILLFGAGLILILVYFFKLKNSPWLAFTGLFVSFAGLILSIEPSLFLLKSDSTTLFPFLKPLLPASGAYLCILLVYHFAFKRNKRLTGDRQNQYAQAESIPA